MWVTALVVAVAVGALARGRANRVADDASVSVAPSDRLLPLRAPEIRGIGGAGAGSGEGEFDASIVAAPLFPSYVEGAIEAGQSLTLAAVGRGVPAEALNPVVAALGELFDFRRSRVGHRFEVELTSDGVITVMRYQTSPEVVYEARRIGERQYEARQVEVELDIEVVTLAGSIDGSFYGAVSDLGEAEALAREVVSIFQWDIDFSRDVRTGDAFRVHFEKVYLEGEFLRYGRVLAAEYRGQRVDQAAYYFDDPEHGGYYTAQGQPLERMFLAAPCRYRRISSRFDLDRMHPVMHRRAPHLGVDYAADTGTPVWAAADGTVSHRGFNPRAGNMVKIRHAGGYETAYAHLSRFAVGIREGDRVEQGQVIGFVGSTGMSTGPHLHYGLKHNGTYVDPLGRDWSRGPSLTGRPLRDFQRRQSQLVAEMEAVAIPEVHAGAPDPVEEVDVPLDLPFETELFRFGDGDGY